ncbi:site-specific integrase [Aquimarina algiphila]|uniref:Tyrosine-type recombinase/integrase n=1 Tax=Aquimarina algiphila TaxID=2047982 RepID=A0A554VJL9_9FLAO|nr:site-specific integrase [Aquimarina algiphila]TSE08118.1 tyrosine-type recombinase/integrase [Aquimarina algiphila]
MATIKVLLHPKSDGSGGKLYRIAIRVTKDRKQNYLYLATLSSLNEWDNQARKVTTKNPKYSQLNRLIRKKYDAIEDLILEYESSKKTYTARQVIDEIKGAKVGETFFQLAEEHVTNLRIVKKHNRAISDNSKINNFLEFVGNKNLAFSDIDETLLNKFKYYLQAKGKVSERSIMNILILIRLLYNRAIKMGIVDRKFYPFGTDKIRIKLPETMKIGLDELELRRIEDLELKEGTTIAHTRNIFLFSFYLAGIRIADILKMKWTDIKQDRLYYKMGKNNKVVSIKLPEKVIDILSYYKKDRDKSIDYIFPELKKADPKNARDVYAKVKTATKKFNNNLTDIAELAEIDKKLTNHIARHSFGNIAGDKVSPQMLQKLYRHTHLSTTIGYQGNFIHKDTDDALEKILNF